MSDEKEYSELAKIVLKTEMARQGVKIPQLVEKLRAEGFNPPLPKTLSVRIGRGQFSAAFLLECLKVLGVKTLSLKDYYPDSN